VAYATNFDKNVKKVLEKKVPEYAWELGWPRKGKRLKVDVGGTLKGGDRRLPRHVLIEAELKKENPVGNVVKIWRWASRRNNAKRILFVQAFSEHYWDTKDTHRVRAVFVGERMKKDRKLHIDYKWLAIHIKPKELPGFRTKEGGGSMVRAAQDLAKQVARLVHST